MHLDHQLTFDYVVGTLISVLNTINRGIHYQLWHTLSTVAYIPAIRYCTYACHRCGAAIKRALIT